MKLLHDTRYAVAAKRVAEGNLAASRAEVAALLELCRELAVDAERYKWLRKQGNREKAADMTLHRMNLDAAIDAEMAGANEH